MSPHFAEEFPRPDDSMIKNAHVARGDLSNCKGKQTHLEFQVFTKCQKMLIFHSRFLFTFKESIRYILIFEPLTLE